MLKPKLQQVQFLMHKVGFQRRQFLSIEFNPWPDVQYLPTEREDMEKFNKFIQDAGYVATIRRSRGQDILGACGQLRTESEKKKSFKC